MTKRDSHLDMNGDDLRATRVLTLAVKFFGTSKPVTSSTIAAELYPNREEGSFRRQFLRDRELLASLGIVIREVEDPDGSLWQIDGDASYAQGPGIDDQSARMLYALCYDMAFDQSFPYRDELRIALAKIAQMYRGTTLALTDTTSAAEHKLLATLVSCMSSHHAVRVTYTNAQGASSERTLALLGSFGLRNHSYFVAQSLDQAGQPLPSEPHTYRLDRFTKVRELPKVRYRVPQDFSVRDYMHLPFQIGPTLGMAALLVGSTPSTEVERAVSLYGSTQEQDSGTVWELPYSSVEGLASWAIAHGLMPLGPHELCAVWQGTLSAAAGHDAYDPSLAKRTNEQRPRSSTPAGRKGSVATIRQLIALASSLTEEGRAVTAHDIAASLGISYDEARHLIALLSLGSEESIDYLPVILSDNDDEVALMEGAALSARRLRLTLTETLALLAALRRLGLNQDDELVKPLTESYVHASLDEEEIHSLLYEDLSDADTSTLRQCSQAITEGSWLTFSYQPVSGGTPSRRRVIPRLIRQDNGFWYLEAYDLVRREPRVFRLDGMSLLEQLEPRGPVPALPQSSEPQAQVLVRFCDQRYLDLFHWEGLQVVDQDERGTVAQLPFFGGSWLARHLAACGTSVFVSDQAIAEQMRSYAQELLV